MPTYEYRCESCKHTFTRVLTLQEREKAGVTCPQCKGKDVRQLVSSFSAKTRRKS